MTDRPGSPRLLIVALTLAMLFVLAASIRFGAIDFSVADIVTANILRFDA